MISTVTTSTVTTVTLAGSFAIIGIFVLLAFLFQKELLSSSEDKRLKILNQVLNIGIAPLLIAFVFVVVTKVLDVIK